MSLRDDVLAVLQNDVTLSALLTGGVYSGYAISRQNTPDAFDANKEVLPCALLKMETRIPLTELSGGQRDARQFFSVMLYARFGHSDLDAARERIFDLLHDHKVGENCWRILHTDDVLDLQDPTLLCAMQSTRFVSYFER